jgi:hypothetical protein
MQDAKTVAFGVLIGNTVQSALQSITAYFSGIVSGNAKLSDSLSDVEKATGLTSSQVADLNGQLSKIDTRTATADLREIAIGLGQIGEAANAENVAAIDKIVVALGDEFGGGAKEITTTLSVLRNNLQDLKTGNYGEDVGRIGNALNIECTWCGRPCHRTGGYRFRKPHGRYCRHFQTYQRRNIGYCGHFSGIRY